MTFHERAGGQWIKHGPAPETFQAAKPFPAKAVTTQCAKKAYALALARAGARERDADDLRVIKEVKARTGRVEIGQQ